MSVHDEDGSVLVVVAVAMPVFLLFLALVVDAGNWFTHSRQLTNRADAGIQAMGVEYGRQWARCTLGTAGPGGQRETASQRIVAAARGYAGADFNAEVTTVDPNDIVVFNSDDPSNTPTEDLCNPEGVVTAPGVKVTEKNIKSLFASFGLPLAQTSATSELELLKASSETGFVPLAIEDQRIVKAQARFFNACTGDALGAPVDLTALPAASPTVPGVTLWSSDVQLTLPNAAPASFASPCPPNFDYEPISFEVRLASRDDVDLNQDCAALIAAPFADCYRNVTQVRAYACQPNIAVCAGRDDDGAADPGDQPLVFDVALSGPTCAPDPYYARLTPGPPSCTLGATVEMDWSDRPVDPTIPADQNFSAKLVVDGVSVDLETPGPELRTLTAAGPVTLDSLGPSTVEVEWKWRSTVGTFNGADCTAIPNPCNQQGTIVVHRTNLADNPATDTSPTDILQLARLSTAASADPVALLDSVPATGDTINVHAVIGLRSEMKPGQFATLRTRFANDRRLVCDPAPATNSTEAMVAEGCKPPYGSNPLDGGFWWTGGTCPMPGTWFSEPYTNTPWRCVRTEPQPTGNAQQVADGLATRTGETGPTCTNVAPDRYLDYFGTRTDPIDPTDPRFVKVYVVPFGGFKGPPDGAVPVLDIAEFYVTDWGAPGGSGGDPCEPDANLGDETTLPGRVAGYFVSTVGSNIGPVEPGQRCDPTALRPCRAVLVR
jgi:hypothetical protein